MMNSWQANQLKYAFGIGGFMSFYGVVGLAVLLLPDSWGYSYKQKIVIIALVLLTLPLALIGAYVVSRRGKKKQEQAEGGATQAETSSANGQAAQKIAAPTGNYGDMTTSAEEVVQFLKTSNLGEGGKDAVYSLPWYLVAGTPKSGKSSLVLSSNLNFQTLPSQRQSEQNLVRSTQSVDWRVTSDAVFVDTAGRYQTDGVDADEWASLLETIKKYRSRRPLDGFLLSVNAEKILQADDAQIEQMAKVLRTRLDDAIARTKTRFPVYLIFTHADAIEGFRDSFSTSKNEGKNLVWGATIPLEKSDNAQTLFDGEYELLQESIMKRRLMRLSAPFPPVRQLKIFNFPLHFGSARRKLGTFVSTLFRPNPFSESPFLRGFYFTAAPSQAKGGQAAQTVGSAFFTEKLFRDVVLRDKDLVRTFQEQRQRPPILGWLLTVFGAFLTFVLLALCAVSLFKNRALLAEAVSKGDAVLTIAHANAGRNPLDKKPEEAIKELDATEDLRQTISKLDDYERDGAPLLMRFGLYSGNKIYKEKLLPIYFSAIEQRFKTPVVTKLEGDLKKFAASQPVGNPAQLTKPEEDNLSKNYDLLKAYLMLSKDYKDKAQGTFLANTLKDYWTANSKIPADMQLTAEQQLDFWTKQVDREQFPRVTLDKNLVEATRKNLKAFPPVLRYYKRKTTEISKIVDDKVGVTTADAILSRNGADATFIESSGNGVPGAYTLEGYKLMKAAINDSDKELSADDWVMGEQGKNAIAQTTDAARLQQIYFGDYIDYWRNFAKGIRVKNYTKDNANEALQTFSSANSPIKVLVNEIARNTNFSAKPKSNGWWDSIVGTVTGLFSKQVSTDTGGSSPVEKEFQPVFNFVGSEGKPNPPIDAYQNQISRVSNKFTGFSPGDINTLSQELSKDNNQRFPELKDATTKITTALAQVGTTPSGVEVAGLLRKPLENLSTLLGTGALAQISKTWTEQILPQAREIEKGFPFQDGQTETDLTKLTAFLNPVNGALSKFYDESLKKDFEGNPGQLKVKDTTTIKYSDEFVAYLNKAFLLREALFGKNATPNYEYELRLMPVAGAQVDVTIDGQKVTSQGTASGKLKFPAPAATDTGVFIEVASIGGTSSTSGATA
ncbi:MAG: type VI secretion system membrane subunit TssM, partial [Acidobacteriota bacterium]|nr:type VI secretion system membrane subunit TssM [Acidobacteriota bacterium]